MRFYGADYPNTGLAALPDLDLELSLSRPGQGPLFRSIVSDARILEGFSSQRGRSDILQRFEAGTSSVTLNNRNRYYDPTYTASPIYGHTVPGRRMRLLARYNSVTYVVFDTFVDEWQQEYPETRKDAVAVVRGTDGFKLLGRKRLRGSWYEQSVSEQTPTYWWHLGDVSGSGSALNSGFASTLPPLTYPTDVTLAAASLIPYDGGRTSATFTGTNLSSSATALGVAPTGTSWSVELWFKCTQTVTAAGPFPTLFTFGGGIFSAEPNFGIYLNNTSVGQLSTRVATNTPAAAAVTSSGRVDGTTGVHHAVATYVDSTRTVTLYLDGTLVGSAAAASGTIAFTDTTITTVGGTTTDFPNNYVTGGATVQGVAVYDGVALSATQVTAHYNAGNSAHSGDASGTRATRILDGIGVATADRDIDTGNSTLGAYEISSPTAIDYLHTLAETEQGQFYWGLDGAMSSDHTMKYVWRQRHALITASRSITSQATFGDGGGSDLPYYELITSNDERELFGEVSVTRNGGDEQRVSDQASAEDYFSSTLEISGTLHANDNDAFDIANWLLTHYKSPQYRIKALVIRPQRDPTNLWPQVLGREIGDRITVKITPAGVSPAISKELIIQGVEHSMAGGLWETTWQLSEADTQQFWVLDDTTLSVLDTTTRLAA